MYRNMVIATHQREECASDAGWRFVLTTCNEGFLNPQNRYKQDKASLGWWVSEESSPRHEAPLRFALEAEDWCRMEQKSMHLGLFGLKFHLFWENGCPWNEDVILLCLPGAALEGHDRDCVYSEMPKTHSQLDTEKSVFTWIACHV
jgi:hypothetical protein